MAIDNQLVGRIATDNLIERGHRRLGFLGSAPLYLCSEERHIGFLKSLEGHGIPVSEGPSCPNRDCMRMTAHLATLEMLKDPRMRPTAIVCFNDVFAIEVYRVAHELSPEDPR